MSDAWLSIEQLASRSRTSVRTLRRRIEAGFLVPAEYRISASGRKVALFREEDVVRIGPFKSRPETWQAFFHRCIKSGCAPRLTLQKLLLSEMKSKSRGTYFDMDLAHAGMRLVFDGDPEFLHMLSSQWALKNSFASEIVRILGPERRIRLTGSSDACSHMGTFAHDFIGLKRTYLDGEILTVTGKSIPLIAETDILHGTRPRYLDRVKCPTIPVWALTSVMPFREGAHSKAAIARMRKLAALRPRLATFLRSVERDLEGLKLDAWALQPIEQDSSKMKQKAKKAGLSRHEQSTTRDNPVAAGISVLIKDLVTQYKVPLVIARRYCWAVHRRIHPDQYGALRQAQQKNWTGPVGVKKLSRAVVNRIFCASRSAEV